MQLGVNYHFCKFITHKNIIRQVSGYYSIERDAQTY